MPAKCRVPNRTQISYGDGAAKMGVKDTDLIGVSDLSHNITTSDMFCSTVYRYPTAMAAPSVRCEHTICSSVPGFPGIPAF